MDIKTSIMTNETKIDLVQINKPIAPPDLFSIKIEMSGMKPFDLLILEYALDKMYEWNEAVPLKNDGTDTLFRWDSLKFLRDSLRTEIEKKVIGEKFYPVDYLSTNPIMAKPYS